MRTFRGLFWLTIGLALSLFLVPLAHAQSEPPVTDMNMMPPQPPQAMPPVAPPPNTPVIVEGNPGDVFMGQAIGSFLGSLLGSFFSGQGPGHYYWHPYRHVWVYGTPPVVVVPGGPPVIWRRYARPDGYEMYVPGPAYPQAPTGQNMNLPPDGVIRPCAPYSPGCKLYVQPSAGEIWSY